MTRSALGFLTLAFAASCLVTHARADDKDKEKKADDKKVATATGNWSWTVKRGDQEFTQKLKLKQEDKKLTGTITGRQGTDTEITEGKVEGDEVTFQVKREINGNAMVIKYKGKLDGDTIKGKASVERDGQTTDRDWEAKREADKA